MIRDLVAHPGRYGFFQAVRLLERMLEKRGGSARKQLRFRNSTSLGFSSSEVESISTDEGERTEQISLKPTFIGLLGLHGTLPLHYTEAVQAGAEQNLARARLAFLDALSSRLVSLFYEAWRAQRFELAPDSSTASLRRRLLALASEPPGRDLTATRSKLQTYFSGLLRHRPTSSVVIEKVLSSYFSMRVELTPSIPTHHPIPESCQARLGYSVLGGETPCMLGSHVQRRDIRCGIRLYPKTRELALRFAPSGPGAAALREVLGLFAVSAIEFEVCVVMPKEEVQCIRLDGTFRLGYDCYLMTEPSTVDRDDLRYLIRTM